MSEALNLVTGAGGWTGGHLVKHLVDRGERVRGMVRNPDQKAAVEALGAEVVLGDLTDADSLRQAAEGVEHVYHIAALFRTAAPREEVFSDINGKGTQRMLDASIDAGVKRFVHCSTVGVHGNIEEPPASEDYRYAPGDMYQRTKLEGEKIALSYFAEGKIPGVVIRPAMIYGPGDERNFKMWKMVKKGLWFYVGDGSTKVHFIDVRDLANAFRLGMEHTEINNEVYIIPGATSVTQKTMADLIARELGVKKPWIHLPVKPMQLLGSTVEALCKPFGISPPIYRRRVDFTKHREFDGSKAAEQLGFKPQRTFEEEIEDITKWYRDNGWI